MLETTPHTRASLRSSAPVTINHPTPVSLDRNTIPAVAPIRVGGSEVVRQAAATGAAIRPDARRLDQAHALGRTGQRVSHGPLPILPHPPASRGDIARSPYRLGASPNR
jgi:hypothetical protein